MQQPISEPSIPMPPVGSEEYNEHVEVTKQIMLDLSSLNRNIVSMKHRNANKMLRKSVFIHTYEEPLYKEPISVRQIIGLA